MRGDIEMSDLDTQKSSHLRLFDLQTIAELTGLSMPTLRRALREKRPAKRLAHHRFGRAIRISEADLEDFLARCRRGAR